MIIKNEKMADVMKSIFDLAYEEAKRIKNINELVGEYKESLEKYTQK